VRPLGEEMEVEVGEDEVAHRLPIRGRVALRGAAEHAANILPPRRGSALTGLVDVGDGRYIIARRQSRELRCQPCCTRLRAVASSDAAAPTEAAPEPLPTTA
jgi:hypothetical protein